MMFVDNSFFADENIRRLGFGIAGAIVVHALIFIWLSFSASQKIISANIFSPPTSVSIRFITPIEKQPVIERVTNAVAQKPLPETLNKIESPPEPQQAHQPISQPIQQEPIKVSKPIEDVIPVVSEINLKGRRVQPEYPKRSLKMHQEGVVWLHVLISETGARQEIKLHKPSKYALLNQAAIKAVKKWTFKPNVVNGRTVRSWVEIPIEFKIQ